MSYMILNALANNPSILFEVKKYLGLNQKINAIKEVRVAGNKTASKTPFGLKEAKDFIDAYYDDNGWGWEPNISKLEKDVMSVRNNRRKAKKKFTKKAIQEQYTFQGVDLRQVDTNSLKDLYKTLKKEMKKRGEKI